MSSTGPEPTPERPEEQLLSIKGLHKSFAVPVLKNLDFALRAGEVHALMGSNGAGKSTVCNIISGIHQPDGGELFFRGRPHEPENIRAAENAGIRMVMQDLNLFPTLSIAENLCFKSLGGAFGLIDKAKLRERARSALSLLNLQHLDTDTPVSALGVGQQQLIEIAGVIANPVRLLILDEPTAALTDPEIEELFAQLDKLRSEGAGIIYISHRMDEISRIADRVSVLRDGERVATVNSSDINSDQIVTLMAGEDVQKQDRGAARPGFGTIKRKPALKIENLGIRGKFENISLNIYSGEVLGIGGLIGSGRTEVLRAIFGADIAETGGMRSGGDKFAKLHRFRSPQEAIQAGIGMIVEDRKDQGLMLDISITSNISIGSLASAKTGPRNAVGWLNSAAESQLAGQISEKLMIKYDCLEQPVSELSGGNQQKVLIARWLIKDLPILLFDEPGRGVDARAKALIHKIIREQAARGKAVVVVSSETRELVEVSDRIVVMSNGRLAGEFDPDKVGEEQLLEASFKYYSKPETRSVDGSSDASDGSSA